VIFSRSKAPSIIQHFSLATRAIPDVFQPARLRQLTTSNRLTLWI
jgi:hypothetical protein